MGRASVTLTIKGGMTHLPAGSVFGTFSGREVLTFECADIVRIAGLTGETTALVVAKEAGCKFNVGASQSWWVDELGPILANGTVGHMPGLKISNPQPACGGVDPE